MPRVKRVNDERGDYYAVKFICPGCGYSHHVTTQHTDARHAVPRWTFNDDYERPTLAPSLLMRSETWTPPVTAENLDEWNKAPWPQTKVPYVCHSFITDGRIQFLGDCTHALAGQTVDLPELKG